MEILISTLLLVIIISAAVYEFRLCRPDQIILYESKGTLGYRTSRFYPRHFSLPISATTHSFPFARYGSMLRAIAHNQAQTAIPGINQLTTGLFRALNIFAGKENRVSDPLTLIADKILTHLPVYEILHTQRIYHDTDLKYLTALERAYPADNSAFLAFREDLDAFSSYCTLFQQELLRRHGLDVTDFFLGGHSIPSCFQQCVPILRCSCNPTSSSTDAAVLLHEIGGTIPKPWQQEMERLLQIPKEIRSWRANAWSLLEQPVFERVQSFVELAVALHSLSSQMKSKQWGTTKREFNIPSRLSEFFKFLRTDDDMRQFLAAAVEYVAVASEGMIVLPITIIRALNDAERIARISRTSLDSICFKLLGLPVKTGNHSQLSIQKELLKINLRPIFLPKRLIRY
ncbi:MAG: hypothetical protein V1799_20270 [bacterium]